MRLIDANKLRDILQNLSYDDWNQGVSTSWADAYSEIADIVDDMPTIDAEPIRHGEWVVDTIYPSGVKKFHCSICGQERTVHEKYEGVFRQNYCPNCGARMDMGEDHT